GVSDARHAVGPRIQRFEEVVGRAAAERSVRHAHVDDAGLRAGLDQLQEELQLSLPAPQGDTRGDPAQHRPNLLLDSGEMPVRAGCRPRGPYSLRPSGRLASDTTRVVVDGTYRATVRVDDRLERVHAAQRADGAVVVTADSDAGIDHVRFALGLDDDHSEFVRRFAADPLLGETLRQVRGLRPVRTGTVAQALLRAVAGQLIRAREARQIERRVIRLASPQRDGLHAPPPAAELA